MSQQEEAVKLPEDLERDQTGVPENPSPVPSAPAPTSPPPSLPPQPSTPLLLHTPTPGSPSLPLLPTPETAPPALSHPRLLEPPEDTGSTTADACPGPSTSRRALQEDLPQGPDAEASSFQPPRPIFTWSSSSASTEYLRLSATRSFSPSCLSLNPSASPPQGFHNVQGNLENLMALLKQQMEDHKSPPRSTRVPLAVPSRWPFCSSEGPNTAMTGRDSRAGLLNIAPPSCFWTTTPIIPS
ncbi:proline-rich protein 36-like [Hemicordylus capensis]|uniref:proline-rich protein 36-like n=1 Tax=Hemicordylus capensis TaxID=884348 RepID=UPI0023028C53|nr:proline-rich protein 36-like [Hemicordylus capensis]